MKLFLILVLILVGLFLLSCSSSKAKNKAEQKALGWVNLNVDELVKPFKEKNSKIDISGNFYVLNSFKYNGGYCVEIASEQRKPPRYRHPSADPTTLPFFIDKEGNVDLTNVECYKKVYEKEKAEFIFQLQQKLPKDYSVFHFFLTREVGNAVGRQHLLRLGYIPNYEWNHAWKYMTDTLILKTLNDPSFDGAMKAYLTLQWELKGDKMVKDFIESVKTKSL